MSTNRTRPDAGWVSDHRLAACRCCGGPLPKGRRTFCGGAQHQFGWPKGTTRRSQENRVIITPGDGCVHEWLLRSSAAYARDDVGARDQGVCALCGLDTLRLKRLIHALMHAHSRLSWPRGAIANNRSGLVLVMRRAQRLLERHRYPVKAWECESNTIAYGRVFGRSHWWEADHIVPVVEGGGECGLDGLRTLCVPCHRDVTAALNRRRAEARRAAKQPALPGMKVSSETSEGADR